MNDIIQVAVNNGLGVASFIVLLFLIKYLITNVNKTLEEISKTLLTIQTTMIGLTERMSDLEQKQDKK